MVRIAGVTVPTSKDEVVDTVNTGVRGITPYFTGAGQPISSPTIVPRGTTVNAPINVGYVSETAGRAIPKTVKPPKVKPPKVTPPKITPPKVTPPKITTPSLGGGAANIGGIGSGQIGPQITIDDQTGKNFFGNTGGYWNPLDGGIITGVGNLNTNDSFDTQLSRFINSMLGQGVPGTVASQWFGDRSPGTRVTGLPDKTGDNNIWSKSAEERQKKEQAEQAEQAGGSEIPTVPNNGVTGMSPSAYESAIQSGEIFPNYKKATWQGNIPQEDDPGAAIGKRYKLLQQNLAASEGQAAGAEQEALNRRFASMGALNSGAALKNASLQSDVSRRRFAEGRNSLGAAESGEKQAAIEAKNQRALAAAQMKISSEEALRGNQLEVAKSKLSAYQFEKQFGLAAEELKLSARIANQNAYIALENLKSGQGGLLKQLLGDLVGNSFIDKLMGGGGNSTSSNPLGIEEGGVPWNVKI